MQIEIMRQENDCLSVYTRWREAGHEGVHHTCILVDDIEEARRACAEAGAKILLDATPPSGGTVLYAELTPGRSLM